MIDLHHTTASFDYVAPQTLEDHLANQVQAVGSPVAFDLYPASPYERNA